MLARVAETEAEAISARTKAALAAAKRRGVKLGNTNNFTERGRAKGRALAAEVRAEKADERAADRAAYIADLRATGATTPSAITRGLNELGVPAPRGGVWTIAQTQRLLARIDDAERSQARVHA